MYLMSDLDMREMRAPMNSDILAERRSSKEMRMRFREGRAGEDEVEGRGVGSEMQSE